MIRYAKPRDIDEALTLLGEARWKIIAGGTDFYPALGSRPVLENVLDINALQTLRGFSETDAHFIIGARTTWTDVIRQDLPSAFDMLKQAALEVGSPQIQNVASIAGNLCNASPAADGVPALLSLDAEVELRSRAGQRFLALDAFILGNRQTALQPGEMVTAIRIPRRSLAGRSAFRKLGARRYLVISIAMVAARLVPDADGRITDASVSVGSCSAVAQRLRQLEATLIGLRTAGDIDRAIGSDPLALLKPIDDVRGSAGYRLAAARELVRRTVRDALGFAEAEAAA